MNNTLQTLASLARLTEASYADLSRIQTENKYIWEMIINRS